MSLIAGSRRASGRARSRPRRGSTGCSGAGASRRGRGPGGRRTRGARRARTASSSGGTCNARPSKRADERAVRVDGQRDDVPHAAVPSASRKTSSTRSDEPGEAPALERLAQPGPGDQHVVVAGREPLGELVERRPQAALQPVPLDCAAKLARYGQAEPRALLRDPPRAGTSRGRGSAWRRTAPCGRRRRSRGSGRDGAGVGSLCRAHAERRLRPLARRRLRIARPARVDIRARNPCRRFRRRTFGWYVRFTRDEGVETAAPAAGRPV